MVCGDGVRARIFYVHFLTQLFNYITKNDENEAECKKQSELVESHKLDSQQECHGGLFFFWHLQLSSILKNLNSNCQKSSAQLSTLQQKKRRKLFFYFLRPSPSKTRTQKSFSEKKRGNLSNVENKIIIMRVRGEKILWIKWALWESKLST